MLLTEHVFGLGRIWDFHGLRESNHSCRMPGDSQGGSNKVSLNRYRYVLKPFRLIYITAFSTRLSLSGLQLATTISCKEKSIQCKLDVAKKLAGESKDGDGSTNVMSLENETMIGGAEVLTMS